MTDEHDPTSARAYDDLRRQVERGVDVEAALDDLHRRAGHGRRPRATAAAAVVVALIAGGVLALTAVDRSDTVSTADTEPPATAPVTSSTIDPRCDGPATFVHLYPDATPAQIQGVRDQLSGLGIDSYEFVDRAATYAEFRRLFADQPDFVDAIDPADLPESFRIDGEVDAAVVAALETLPGVLRVESSRGCQEPAGAKDEATTTSLDGGD